MEDARKAGLGLLIILTAVIVVMCCMISPIPQPSSYHLFADQRSFLGVPNFADVLSNLPFAVVGIWGLVFLWRSRSTMGEANFIDQREIWPFFVAFAGLLLTAIGSSYYHLAPDNARLVWDRLPMTITFMAMVAAIITERIHLRLGLWLLPVLLLIGLMSVLHWYWSETRGKGDLRFYAAVQVYSTAVILLALFLPPRYTRSSDYGLVLGFYALAKGLELFDRQIFGALHVVSGHSLKHVAAAAAGFCILIMVERRKAVAPMSETMSLAATPD